MKQLSLVCLALVGEEYPKRAFVADREHFLDGWAVLAAKNGYKAEFKKRHHGCCGGKSM